MSNLEITMETYLTFCQDQKRLDYKTMKAYQINLKQFSKQIMLTEILEVTPNILENFITSLHQSYQPKTVKRKIASLKAFFHYTVIKIYTYIAVSKQRNILVTKHPKKNFHL